MESRTAAYDTAVIRGGRVVAELDVYRSGSLLVAGLPIQLGGTITVDGEAEVRRSLSCSVIDTDGSLVPSVAADSLSPYGSEVHVRVGFRYTDGSTETVPVGVFRIQDVEPDSGHLVPLVGEDRSVVVAAAIWEEPYVVTDGTNLGDAVETAMDLIFPGLTHVHSPTSVTLPLTVFQEGGNPWADLRKLVRDAAGFELFFDTLGRDVLRPVPDPTTSPVVWDHTPGQGNLLLAANNRQSGRPIRNVAIAEGEGSGVTTPIRSVAEITDPLSPIFPGLPGMGRRPTIRRSPAIATQAQADAAATADLQLESGRSEQFRFTAAPHPAHDAGDVVHVEEVATEVDAAVVLDSFTLALDLLSPTTYETLARRSVA